MECFVCGRKYDPENKKMAIELYKRWSSSDDAPLPVYSITYHGRILALCHHCVKAIALAQLFRDDCAYSSDCEVVFEPEDETLTTGNSNE